MNRELFLIIFLIGVILIFHMLKGLCGCKVVEGMDNKNNKNSTKIQLIYGTNRSLIHDRKIKIMEQKLKKKQKITRN